MADDGTSQAGEVWPKPRFHFHVDFGGGTSAEFQEISGLDTEIPVIEFRHVKDSPFAPMKLSGLSRHRTATLKRGVFPHDGDFHKWYRAAVMDEGPRRTVTVTLRDEEGGAAFRWALSKAWLTKLSFSDLKSEGTEIAVEAVELAFERLEALTA